MAHAASVELDSAGSRLADDAVGVNGSVDVRLHHANAIGVLEQVDETCERRGLARTWGAHDVEEELLA